MSWAPAAVRTRADGLRRSLRALRAELTSPLPVVRLQTRPAVPGWAVRILLLALGVTSLALLRPGGAALVVLVVVLGALTVRPTGSTAAAWCVAVGVAWLVFPLPIGPTTCTLLAVVSGAVALATTVAGVPVLARVELAALRPGLVRYAVVQLVSQPVVGAALVVRAQRLDLLPLAVGAAIVAAVVAWVVLPRLAES
jgi:hypothetical protein